MTENISLLVKGMAEAKKGYIDARNRLISHREELNLQLREVSDALKADYDGAQVILPTEEEAQAAIDENAERLRP